MVSSTDDELGKSRSWFSKNLGENAVLNPFSFIYGGISSKELLLEWKRDYKSEKLDSNRTEHLRIYADSKTGLELRCVAIEYLDFPTVEWTVYLKNTGSTDTPIIEKLLALDSKFRCGSDGESVLHHNIGSPCKPYDYQPLDTPLPPNTAVSINPGTGRPTDSDMPYFNIEWKGEGIIVVVGWPGQWSAQFSRDNDRELSVFAGQELTHFKLNPGEEVRTPLIVLQFYKGDRVRSQNIWRRWMLAHNLPKIDGETPKPFVNPASSRQFDEMINANEANQIQFIDGYLKRDMKPDYWWMDAGWYPNNGIWSNTGTWEVDEKRFPNGLKAISDYAHSKDIKTLLWFEPERVTPETWLFDNHPEWLLKTPPDFPDTWVRDHDWRLLNMGNPDAIEWLTDHVDGLIKSQGIDLYRQDYNIQPLLFWRYNDAEDRQGITENHCVVGYLAYWDELRTRHPNMLIDSCASGGRRNDLETMRRSVPFFRSDYLFEPIGQQCHTYGLSSWLPYYGTGIDPESDSYSFRSSMCPCIIPCWDVRRDDLDYPMLKMLLDQWREAALNFSGDYYPLTPYSLENNVWMAWQFDRPEVGLGMIEAFRRGDSSEKTRTLKLHGLDSEAIYEVKDFDSKTPQKLIGHKLMNDGLPVTILEPSNAVMIIYNKVK